MILSIDYSINREQEMGKRTVLHKSFLRLTDTVANLNMAGAKKGRFSRFRRGQLFRPSFIVE